MILYHGSNVEVRVPQVLKPNRGLDFGPGFYTTLNHDQAVEFAGKVVLRKGGKPVANDDVYRTLFLYVDGMYSREDTLKLLKVKELYNQLVFATPKALSFIRFLRSEEVL